MSERDAAPAGSAPASSNLVMRAAAAIVLAPLAIALAYAGGWLWAFLVTLVSIGLFAEWLMVVGAGAVALTAAGTIVLAIIGFCVAFGALKAAVIIGVIGGAVIALLAGGKRVWAASGFAYASAALLASILVRQDPVNGFVALMFVLLVVWATDIGGYFAGRGIGGPKLWPRVSPKKTWAGALGGFTASLVVAGGFGAAGLGKAVPLLLVGAVLSVVSQLGDLFESAVKRRFGVKDSSHLIPGHGGLLDRLDGFVAAILVAWIVGFLRHGVHSAGSGLMVW
ncbi:MULTISPECIES: phosphatidate cytidylyltransferase [unclassified Bradyrhizobium]|uniref:phosphatidate cytidylyltransferase n=1 Tax=unclassified Bradyrhizobium TaxID=2631580 RepID=UPI002478CAE0|nr:MULTISPECIES: phosphatidate cytidylyltransferase [unclassified Bradyrhizobium]WGR74860.1 phosphatidate cytidylyltransferase [Bradyrhizobium sp. ISRA426]WGR79696.1 phosphatidate cytidylyltransferase [Bradyrhizobium sp. ISRA430]WGR90032.1 phosphatidate cytidylyltransferase [Bradyrhizobium sp. ISRA432]